MITLGDLAQLQRRGMSGVVPNGPGSYLDQDTGKTVIPYGNGTYLDPDTGVVMDSNGRVIGNIRAGYTPPAAASSSSSGPSIEDIQRLALAGTAVAGGIANALRGPQPAYVPPPSAPMSTGAKVAIGVGLLGVGAGIGYATDWFGFAKKSRRRR